MSESKDIGRRDFMKGAMSTLATVSLAAGAQQGSIPPEVTDQIKPPNIVEVGAPNSLTPYLKVGQPIEISGKRLAFTNYEHILPGEPTWLDNEGRNVTVTGTADLFGAHLRETDAPVGIRIAAEPAVRSPGPYELERIKPWEHDGISLCDIAFDEDMEMHWAGNLLFDDEDGYIKAWGNCSSNGISYRCFLQTKDLQTWERPELGLVEFGGNKRNNLIQLKDRTPFGNVFKDPSSREERWKWVLESETTLEELEAYRKNRPLDYDPKAMRLHVKGKEVDRYHILAVKGGVSPDGFRWTTLPEPLVIEHSDTLHSAYYDTDLKRYVAYFRMYAMPRYSSRYSGDDHGQSWKAARRSIGRAETDDFRKFPLSEMIMEPTPDAVGPSDTFYMACHTFVPGTKDHLFFPTIWHQDRDTTSVAVAASRDGRLMHWLPGSPVLTTSAFGEWDGGCLFALPNLIEIPNGDWILPYIGFNVPHKYPRRGAFKYGYGLATWPKGRLVGVDAGEQAQFTTYAFVPPGRKIRLNALTPRGGGSILVEVVSLSKSIVPGRSFQDCKPIVGDQRNALVTWNDSADIGAEAGAPIALRFRMDHAKLYFVDFEA